jgi:hypothetical protein
LCNEAAADVLEEIVSSNLHHVYLGHLSRDCNRPELALEVVSTRLEKTGARHIKVENTYQDAPCTSLVLNFRPAQPIADDALPPTDTLHDFGPLFAYSAAAPVPVPPLPAAFKQATPGFPPS